MQDYYNQIKNELISNELYKKVKDYSKCKHELNTYYNVGEILTKAGKHYGENIINTYSKKLCKEISKKYSPTNLKYMRQFYNFCKKRHALRDNLSWTHYRVLLPIKDDNKIDYYMKIASEQNLSYRKLEEKIKSKEYERLPIQAKNELIDNKKSEINDFIKNPIIIKNNLNIEKLSEKILQKLILEDIPSFLEQLGDGFCFIKNEYPIKLGNIYNYIDLLLFNIKFNCYVVVELKITSLKKEHIGQIETYMNYIDKHIKEITHDKTIGIIITKQGNDFVMEYCSDKRIYDTTFILNR